MEVRILARPLNAVHHFPGQPFLTQRRGELRGQVDGDKAVRQRFRIRLGLAEDLQVPFPEAFPLKLQRTRFHKGLDGLRAQGSDSGGVALHFLTQAPPQLLEVRLCVEANEGAFIGAVGDFLDVQLPGQLHLEGPDIIQKRTITMNHREFG